MRTYYCDCGDKVEVIKNVVKQCECGKIFGTSNSKVSDHINMRTTWSSQTQVEFSQTTMDADIAERNAR
jgi:acetone carboxylase gamma subunit